MNTQELRALDAHIAEHVMGWQWWRFNYPGSDGGCGKWQQLVPPHEKWPETRTKWNGKRADKKHASLEDCSDFSIFHPTTDPAAAMKVLKKCAEKTDQISIVECRGDWAVTRGDGNGPTTPDGEGKTLELAIALFAQKLFSK